MIQKQFAERLVDIAKDDKSIVGVAVAGSWLTNEIDEFSDLDLILVTVEQVAGDKQQMIRYASAYGKLLSAFTGEHVGEPRLLICLYDDPLLHVDIKFLTLSEFGERIETPTILFDTDSQLKNIVQQTEVKFPYPDYQWIEDRFWIWIHYALLKIGRGEYFEALDFLGYLRMVVLGPLLHIKNGNLPRGVRKVETQLQSEDFKQLKSTVAQLDKQSLMHALGNAVELYCALRITLFNQNINLHKATEERVRAYFEEINKK